MKKNSKIFIIIVILVTIVMAGVLIGSRTAKKNNDSKSSDSNTSASSKSSPYEISGLPEVPSSPKNSDIIIFYGSTCSHCKKVEAFMTANNINKRIKIDMREVFNNEDNANLMTTDQDKCTNLSEDDKGGVPFLYSAEENQCIVGDSPIINYLTASVKAQ